MNVALDGPRDRVAVAADDMIFLYELMLSQQTLPGQEKLPQQTLSVQQMLPGQQKVPHHNRQTKGKPSISSEPAEFVPSSSLDHINSLSCTTANSFKYVFVETTSSWFIGSCHSSLSFSSDGTAIAGSTAMNSPNYSNGQVRFWETATGAATSTFNNWSSVAFSPTDPDMAIVATSKNIQLMKRDSPGRGSWSLKGTRINFVNSGIPTFTSDGKTITQPGYDGRLFEFKTNVSTLALRCTDLSFTATSVASCPLEPDLLIVGRDNGQLVIVSPTDNSKLHCKLTPVGYVRVSACAWSQDRKWIVTGDNVGEVRLWNASVTTSVSLARILLPHDRPGPTTSLIFVPDSTALIILRGGYLTVWDIGKGVYVKNSGLPATAMNIALDSPRDRVAVAVNDKISLYELKLTPHKRQIKGNPSTPSEPAKFDIADKVMKSQQTLPGRQEPPHPNQQTKGKPSISPELAAFDITNKVVQSKPDPFVSVYFDIYRGVWNFDTPRIVQLVVTIKALRPAFNPCSKTQERQDFEDLFTKCLTRWSNLSHDNLAPLLGISMDFGRFPAIITSWTTNGLLSEYINSDEEYDKMQLIVSVARGVAYIHSEGIVHSDIRASSFLVDELGKARLADPGLYSVLANSPLLASGAMVSYRWMAPELLKNSSAKATFATDVYSVTMTSLEIFTASDPFEGHSDALVPSQVLQNQRPERPEDVGDELWSLWNEGWNQDPTKRPDMVSYVGHLNQLT
ncbi:kinase-like protein [Phlegmacium glaucopus]|nr:kinase-like protein [Phlegmacium glaucopus]